MIDKNEDQAKHEILNLVKEYYNNFHKKDDYKEGDRIPYAARVYDSEEMVNLIDSGLEFWLTSGRYTKRFESDLCDFLNIKYSFLVNSGSSANLLAFYSLTSPLLKERAIKRGDEVITVAAGFPTTVTPIIQFGAVPVFVDITIPHYNIDTKLMKKALTAKTKAVMIAHTLGNPFNLKSVKDFCDENNLWLIEDNCDALGSKYIIDGKEKFTGTIGDIGTSSFYPPHHITMGEGGAVYTDNPLLAKIIQSMRDWGRDCVCPSGVDNFCKHRFDTKYGELPEGYDHKYVYSHFGFNLKATDMQAAIGCAQLKKLAMFTKRRRENFEILKKVLMPHQDKLILPESTENSIPSWFGFLITCREEINRNKITAHLESKKIQTRLLFAGNLVKQKCFDEMRAHNEGFRIAGELTNTDIVMKNSFWVGVYPGMTEEMVINIGKAIIESLSIV